MLAHLDKSSSPFNCNRRDFSPVAKSLFVIPVATSVNYSIIPYGIRFGDRISVVFTVYLYAKAGISVGGIGSLLNVNADIYYRYCSVNVGQVLGQMTS